MTNIVNMFVIKRDGSNQKIFFDKITERINKLKNKNEKNIIDSSLIAQKVISGLYSGITTEELDKESAKICMNLSTLNPSYGDIAGKILASNLQKKTLPTFTAKMNLIQEITRNSGKPLLDSSWLKWINSVEDDINNIVDYSRDLTLNFFAFKTLERSYLIKNLNTGEIIERPQDLFLRVASFINKGDLELTKKTYDLLSTKCYSHGSPTFFNAGTSRPQLSSCFLLGTEDSLEGITKTWDRVSNISKWGGGLGIHISNIRAKDSKIRGTNGLSSGLVPMLEVYNYVARYFNQGGKRKGSFAMYLDIHHPDILDFLKIRTNFGTAQDLFTGLMVSDCFMKQVENDKDWFLFCPDEAPGLDNLYGEEYEKLYWKYVSEKKYKSKILARTLIEKIFDAQLETGTPYILYKDAINKKSNQKNIGVIKSSNLCAEIVEYSDDKEHAVCNLASICLNHCLVPFKSRNVWTVYTKQGCKYCVWTKKYITNNNYKFSEIEFKEEHRELLLKNTDCITFPQIFYGKKYVGGFNELIKFTASKYNFDMLQETAFIISKNLNKIIDINYYPTKEAEYSNKKNRPIGIGIQGLADTLVQMRIPFDSDKAVEFNEKMMEYIYYGALTASMNTAKEQGGYSTFKGSPLSEGKFQFDLWDVKPKYCNWDKLREDILKYGVRNSLVTALMPTASTSQIMGNNECFEWFTNNIYTRKVLSGDFPVVNKHLVKDFMSIGVWDSSVKEQIVADNGSVKNIDNIPNNFKMLYKTIWEIPQIWVLKNARARGPFVDQTQSMNIFYDTPNYKKLYSCLMWGWKQGLKTGIYYLRSKPAQGAVKITVDPKLEKKMNEECESCSG